MALGTGLGYLDTYNGQERHGRAKCFVNPYKPYKPQALNPKP